MFPAIINKYKRLTFLNMAIGCYPGLLYFLSPILFDGYVWVAIPLPDRDLHPAKMHQASLGALTPD
jgi:hypothetical protein|nr:hypothetical protein [uncultured Desulfobacter sp.]